MIGAGAAGEWGQRVRRGTGEHSQQGRIHAANGGGNARKHRRSHGNAPPGEGNSPPGEGNSPPGE
eukprot:795189-Prorocentrum_minimum.AAC.1